MTQDHITRFNVHTAGMFSSQDADSLQPLLKAAKDEAYAELMAVKTPKYTLLYWVLYILLAASVCHLLFSTIESQPLTIAAIAVAVVSLALIIFIPPYKKRTFRNYSKVLERYK